MFAPAKVRRSSRCELSNFCKVRKFDNSTVWYAGITAPTILKWLKISGKLLYINTKSLADRIWHFKDKCRDHSGCESSFFGNITAIPNLAINIKYIDILRCIPRLLTSWVSTVRRLNRLGMADQPSLRGLPQL